MTEVVVTFAVSIVGTVASAALLVDSIVDRTVARKAGHPELVSVATQHIVSEAIRLTAVLIFLGLATTYLLAGSISRDAFVWLLMAVPFLATSSSIYAWVWRRVQFSSLRSRG